jgi:hypothetical protein
METRGFPPPPRSEFSFFWQMKFYRNFKLMSRKTLWGEPSSTGRNPEGWDTVRGARLSGRGKGLSAAQKGRKINQVIAEAHPGLTELGAGRNPAPGEGYGYLEGKLLGAAAPEGEPLNICRTSSKKKSRIASFPGNPAVSFQGKETRGFPPPPRDGFSLFWSLQPRIFAKLCQEKIKPDCKFPKLITKAARFLKRPAGGVVQRPGK